MSTSDHSRESRRYAASSSDGGILHQVDEIVDYASPHAYYLARCGAHVRCRTADVFKERDVPAMLCRACRDAAAATS